MSLGAVLFVDDEAAMRQTAAQWLQLSGFDVVTAEDGKRALCQALAGEFDVVVTDVRMPMMDGLALLESLRKIDPDLPVVLLTGHGDITTAVEAMRSGAYDFLEKPYDADHFVSVVNRAAEKRRLTHEVRRLRGMVGGEIGIEGRLVGVSAAMQAVRRQVLNLASLDIDVVIRGATGSGKEVVARCLHDFGHRAKGPFVALNCAAIPVDVFESELFGYMPGAFTGATGRRIGKFEHAGGGTLFLDEIESMPLALQAKVLRVLQERVVEPLGSNKSTPVDFRVIAASKVNLKAESDAGRFRADLYYRLNTVEIMLPPLVDRLEDIPVLFSLFVSQCAARHDRPPRSPGAREVEALMTHHWPGNVRELRSAAERFCLGLIPPGLPLERADEGAIDRALTLPERVAGFERLLISEALKVHGGDTAAAANALGVPRRTLNEKISRLGVERDER